MRRRRRNQKPMDRNSLIGAGVALAVEIFFIAACVHSVNVRGNNGTLVPASGVLLMLVSVWALVLGIRERKSEAFSVWSRVVGVVIPALALLSWVVLYFIGLFVVR